MAKSVVEVMAGHLVKHRLLQEAFQVSRLMPRFGAEEVISARPFPRAPLATKSATAEIVAEDSAFAGPHSQLDIAFRSARFASCTNACA